jgi:hypothetical protein
MRTAFADLPELPSRQLAKGDAEKLLDVTSVPEKFRGQVQHVLRDTFREIDSDLNIHSDSEKTAAEVENLFSREHGIAKFPSVVANEPNFRLSEFLSAASDQNALDLVAIIAHVLNSSYRRRYEQSAKTFRKKSRAMSPDAALGEINQRLEENRMAWRYREGQLICVLDEYSHRHIVLPVLDALLAPDLSKAKEDFLKAFDFYRAGDHPEAITSAGRAFESVLKTICKRRSWHYNEGVDTAARLVEICRSNGLFPDWLEDSLTKYTEMVKAGIPKVRNKLGAHGVPPNAPEVASEFVLFAINQSASTILLLLRLEQALPT